MSNEVFDETTERDYDPIVGIGIDLWENNPLVWQEPMDMTPFGWTLHERYDEDYRQTETKTLVDVVLERPQFQGATDEFRMYLEAIVVAKEAQLSPDRLPVMEDQALRQLSMQQQLQVVRKLERLTELVFQWMTDRQMDPIPGTTQWPGLISQSTVEYVMHEY